MKECPNCAVEIKDQAVVCPICGYEFPQKPVLPWKPIAALVLLALLLPLLIKLFRMLR